MGIHDSQKLIELKTNQMNIFHMKISQITVWYKFIITILLVLASKNYRKHLWLNKKL